MAELEVNNAEQLKNQLTIAKCEIKADTIKARDHLEKTGKLTFQNTSRVEPAYLSLNDYLHTIDLNPQGTRLVVSGTLLRLVTMDVEDGNIVDQHAEETMLFDVRFDQSSDIW